MPNGASVDQLYIDIQAKATKANDSIDKLVEKLDKLSGSIGKLNGSSLTGLANGVQKLGTAMQTMNQVKTADFTRLAKNLQKLGNINVTALNSAASSLSHLTRAFNNLGMISQNAQQVGEMAKNLSKLGSKSVQQAITNIPSLAIEMKNLMTTLSKSPQVSQNIIQMTNALANLASQGNKIKSASNTLNGGFNRTNSAMTKTAKTTLTLAGVFGKFYASYFWLIRGIKSLWKSIESSMDYMETLNYFEASFGQVAESAVSQWEEAGYDSAQAYYNSFSTKAKQLMQKMTGFSVTGSGMLQSGTGKSLGIDPNTLMQYQAMFGQMSNSIGITAETSLKLSNALTMIGADLASVKNMDFNKVWTDMASGLAGMSRTLDKYGVNIRNVNLQQKLNELGIQANIQALNQNDKALLRTIILLDSTRYAWGDLAETIDNPANQLRMLQNNFSNLSRTIGNIFLPIVAKVLPYVNALVVALQKLAEYIVSLLGFEGFEWGGSSGGNSDVMSDLYDSIEETGGALDNATGKAKKLKKQLQGFDELNVINTQDDSGGSSGGVGGGINTGLLEGALDKILEEYQKAWDEAYTNMENRVQVFANKISKVLEPVKKLFTDIAIGDWFAVGEDTSNIVSGIFNFFANAIDSVDWNTLGHNIGLYLAGINWTAILSSIGNLIWQALKATIELWSSSFSAAPIETGIISAIALLKWTSLGAIVSRGITKAIATKLGIEIAKDAGIGTVLRAGLLKKIVEALSIIGTNIGLFIEGIFSGFSFLEALKYAFPKIGELATMTGNWVKTVAVPTLASVGGKLASAISGPWGIAIAAAFAGILLIVTNWDAVYEFAGKAWKKVVEIFEQAGEWFDTNVITPIISLFEGLFDRVGQFFEGLWIITQAVWIVASSWFDQNVVQPIVSSFAPIVKSISDFFSIALNNIKSVWSSVSTWFNNTIINPVKNAFKSACDTIGGFFSNLWAGIKKGVVNAMNAAIGGIEKGINFIVNGINKIIGGFNKIVSWAAKVAEVNWGGVSLVPKVNLSRISGYELGGFPESASLFWAGENGVPELLGTINGKTAVAGGAEITGIREAIYSTAAQEVEIMREQNRLLRGILEKEFGITGKDIFDTTRRYADEYMRKTGNPAFAY